MAGYEEVAKDLRSILMSHGKRGASLGAIRGDYEELTGERIPFASLGFDSLPAFLQASPDICTVTFSPKEQEHIYYGVFDEATRHVAEMKLAEKSSSKGARRRPPPRPGVPRRPLAFNGYSGSNRGSRGRGFASSSGRGARSGAYPTPRGRGSAPASAASRASVAKSSAPAVDYKGRLLDICGEQGLPAPQFVATKTGGRFLGSIRIGNKSYNTFPEDFADDQQALQRAAKKALDELQENKRKTESTSSSVDLATLNARVADFVRDRPCGLWSSFVEKAYEEKFKECLPKNWVEQLLKLGNVLIEADFNPQTSLYIVKLKKPAVDEGGDVEGERIDANNNETVDKRESETVEALRTLTIKGSNAANNNKTVDKKEGEPTESFRALSIKGSKSSTVSVPKPQLPKDGEEWLLMVSSVEGMKFHVRFVSRDEEFHNMITDLELFYIYDAANTVQVEEPKVGEVYAAAMETAEWQRVRVVSIRSDAKAECLLIDVGRHHNIDVSKLRQLTPKFAQIPAQALEVELEGLENESDDIIVVSKAAGMLLGGRKFRGQVVKTSSANPRGLHTLVLTDAEDGRNCNEALINCIRGNQSGSAPLETPATPTSSNTPASSPLSPRDFLLTTMKSLVFSPVPEVGEYFDVTVVSVLDPDSFFVQPLSSFAKLRTLQRDMNLYYNEPKNRSVFKPDNSGDPFCAVLSPEDGNWYRARLTDMIVNSIHVVTLVDQGRSEHVKATSLQPLAVQFRNLPIQAIHAKMHGVYAVAGQWSVDDGRFFSESVLFKQFVSVIKERREVGNEGEIVLGLSLVDTSHPTIDVYVETLLVDAKRAVKI